MGEDQWGVTHVGPRAPGDVADILNVLGLPGMTNAERITTGWGGTAIWRMEREGRTEALRIFSAGAHEARDREVAAMAAALTGGVPAPEVVPAKSHPTHPAIVTTWCPGRTIAESLATAPWRARALGAAMGRTQARLHRVVAPEIVRRRSPDWVAWAGSDEDALGDRVRALPLRPDALLHLDFHPANVLVEDGRVTGVVDWENTRAGDPRADVARTASILWLARQSPELPRWSRPVLRLLETGWRQGYRHEARAGHETGRVTDMPLFDAWACAAMISDLTPKVGMPGVWIRPEDLDDLRQRLARFKRRAGL